MNHVADVIEALTFLRNDLDRESVEPLRAIAEAVVLNTLVNAHRADVEYQRAQGEKPESAFFALE